MRIIEALFGNLLKGAGLWAGYHHRKGLATAVRRGAKAVYRNSHVRDAARKLESHCRASRWQFWWLVILPLIIATLGGVAFGIALRFPLEQGLADSLHFWGKAVFMGFGAVAVTTLFYITMKIVFVRGLLLFIVATVRTGYESAIGILPNIIGYHLRGVIDPVLEPIKATADLIEFYALSVVMAVGSVWMFITVFDIHLNLWAFSLVIVAIMVLVAVVIRDKNPPVWLRRVAIAMSVVSLIVGALASISPSLRTVNGIRQDCISKYYLYGTPKDTDQVKLCEKNVEAEMMSNLTAFVALKGKKLTAAQVDEWRALDVVIFAALEDKPKIEDKPKPLDWSTRSAPAPSPAAVPTATGTKAPAKTQNKKPAAASAPKPAANEVLAKILARQRDIDKNLGR